MCSEGGVADDSQISWGDESQDAEQLEAADAAAQLMFKK